MGPAVPRCTISDRINKTQVNQECTDIMDKNAILKKYRVLGIKEWAQVTFMIMICLAGGYLIIYSVYMMTTNHDPSLFMFSIAMFGVGCTAIWFGLSHVEIQSTEEKLESITKRLDSIIEKMEEKQ